MPSYKELYFYLFAAIADAVEDLERGRVILAIRRLIAAQREAEERVLELDIVPERAACAGQGGEIPPEERDRPL